MGSSRLSIKVIRSAKCEIVKNDGVDVHGTAINHENKQIHEHDFITARIKETNSFLVHCTTCYVSYCDHCGKAFQ